MFSSKNGYKKYFLGIDIGSVSVNLALIDEDLNICLTRYERSHGEPFQTLINLLAEINQKIPIPKIGGVGFTGSGARKLARLLEFSFFNEVLTQFKATSHLYPEVRSIIDMGGEDSKLILVDKHKSSDVIYIKDFALSTLCAAGTGSFLDQQAKRLGLSIEHEFGQLALKSKSPPRIAGRCSVFAKTDMIHLQQEATSDYDIVAGLCFALARNFKTNIGKGKKITKPVSFQGGVAANQGMVRAFQEVLSLSKQDLIIPPNHGCMGAIGASLLSMEKGISKVSAKKLTHLEKIISTVQVDFKSKSPLGSFNNRAKINPSYYQRKLPSSFRKIDGFLGIDVGSISTNVVVIDSEGKLIAREYLMTGGRPLEAVKKGLKRIYRKIGQKVNIAGVGTTGSGRYLTGDFVGADVVKNEITSQATASIYIDPSVDTIFEIGGQDSKYISLRDGMVVDFKMNKVCAAGTGSFLEEQAERLNINIKEDFSSRALRAPHPCDLGQRCTVFMESSLMNAQHQGANVDNLLGGLCYSIAYNYLNLVVEDKPIGEKIFFQGGVAFNEGVVAAFRKILEKQVIVPPFHEVTGAIGVALLAKKKIQRPSKFRGFNQIIGSHYELSSFMCQHCPNHCKIKKVGLENGKTLYYGSRCDRYELDRTKAKMEIPDLFKEREKFLTAPYKELVRSSNTNHKSTVGIPWAMLFHELLPLWISFFKDLGYKIILSDKTNQEIVNTGLEKVGLDVCFPIKAAHGHVINLLKKRVDYIFLPTILNMPKDNSGMKQSVSCPYVQSLPFLIKGAIDFRNLKVKLLNPEIVLGWGRKLAIRTLAQFAQRLGASRSLAKKVSIKALSVQENFYRRIQERGRQILTSLESSGEKAVVIFSRPYNGYDQGINLNLPSKLRKLGILPIPLDFLPLHKVDLSSEWPDMYWAYGQKILAGAELVKESKNLIPIYVSNFGCGPDSFITHFFRRKMDQQPYLQLEIDEHTQDVGVITRCEAFLDSINNVSQEIEKFKSPSVLLSSNGFSKDYHLYIPRMGDHAIMLKAAFEANGFNAEVFPPSNQETIYWGRKFTSGRECLPCILTTGDIIRITQQDEFNPNISAFFMPTTEGPCRFGQYRSLQRVVLNELGFDQVPIFSPNQAKSLITQMGPGGKKVFNQAWQGIVATDFLVKLLHKFRPYERKRGQTQAIYKNGIDELYNAILNHHSVIEVLEKVAKKFNHIEIEELNSKPVIGIVGEIYVRNCPFANENLIQRVEDLGGEVWLAPISEWLFHVTRTFQEYCRFTNQYIQYLTAILTEKFQKRYEKKVFNQLKSLLEDREEPSIREVEKNCGSYLPFWFGESALGIGKTIDYYKRGAAGVINVMPFSCLPGNIFSSVLQAVKRDYQDLPVMVVAYDGLGQSVNVENRLEAFMYQAKQRWSRIMKDGKFKKD